LLIVLNWPAILLNTNCSERDIRLRVIKRKISDGTCSLDRRGCRDACLGVMRTAAKLGIASGATRAIGSAFPASQTFNICQTSPVVVASSHETGDHP
jgi:hypothetical protein